MVNYFSKGNAGVKAMATGNKLEFKFRVCGFNEIVNGAKRKCHSRITFLWVKIFDENSSKKARKYDGKSFSACFNF